MVCGNTRDRASASPWESGKESLRRVTWSPDSSLKSKKAFVRQGKARHSRQRAQNVRNYSGLCLFTFFTKDGVKRTSFLRQKEQPLKTLVWISFQKIFTPQDVRVQKLRTTHPVGLLFPLVIHKALSVWLNPLDSSGGHAKARAMNGLILCISRRVGQCLDQVRSQELLLDGRIDACVGGWVDGRMGEWVGGWIYYLVH